MRLPETKDDGMKMTTCRKRWNSLTNFQSRTGAAKSCPALKCCVIGDREVVHSAEPEPNPKIKYVLCYPLPQSIRLDTTTPRKLATHVSMSAQHDSSVVSNWG